MDIDARAAPRAAGRPRRASARTPAWSTRIRDEIRARRARCRSPGSWARAVRPGRRLLRAAGAATGPRRRLHHRARAPSDLRRDAVAGCRSRPGSALGEPDRFVVREYGAGTGALARGDPRRPARRAPLADAVRYQPVEVAPRRLDALASAARRGRARGRLDSPRTPARRRRSTASSSRTRSSTRCRSIGSAARRRPARGRRRLSRRRAPSSRSRSTRSTPALAARLDDEGIALVDGQTAEICLALDALGRATRRPACERGLLLLIDYGAPAAELYDPVRRRDGTLRAYVRHQVHDDPYRHVGRQDLTAHVDVTAVERAAHRGRADHRRHHDPGRGLVGLGIEDRLRAIQADPATTLEAYLVVAIGAHAPAGPGRDGPVPGDGLRPRLAGRPARRAPSRYRLAASGADRPP